MAGNFNAIGIIGTVLLTVFVLLKFAKKPDKTSRISTSILITCLIALLHFATSSHLCRSGQPFTQWLIPDICLGCILIFVEPKSIRRGVALILIITGFILSQQFVTLVHSDTYIGNPDWMEKINFRNSGNLKSVKNTLSDVAKDNSTLYQQGWLSDSELKQFIPEDIQHFLQGQYRETYILWHTFLTGLYGRKISELDMWYPGGMLKDALDKIEFRRKYIAPTK